VRERKASANRTAAGKATTNTKSRASTLAGKS